MRLLPENKEHFALKPEEGGILLRCLLNTPAEPRRCSETPPDGSSAGTSRTRRRPEARVRETCSLCTPFWCTLRARTTGTFRGSPCERQDQSQRWKVIDRPRVEGQDWKVMTENQRELADKANGIRASQSRTVCWIVSLIRAGCAMLGSFNTSKPYFRKAQKVVGHNARV